MITKPKRGGARAGAGRKSSDGVAVVRKNVTLDAETIATMRKIGGGDLSIGIRRAARQLGS